MSHSEEAGGSAVLKGELRTVLIGLMMVMGLASLDQNIVNTALPRITADLGGASHLSWVVTAFLLTSTLTTPLYGKLADMFGRRRILIISVLIFLAASALGGVAQSMPQLIAFRALQGVGGGGLITLVMIIVGDLVPPHDRPRYQGLFMGVFAISSVAGPLAGGFLTTALSWRWVFYVNLPLGVPALALILAGLHPTKITRRHAIDYLGAGLLAIATTALMLLLSWGLSQKGMLGLKLGLAALSAVSLAAFVWQERRAAEPILDLGLFQNKSFVIALGVTGVIGLSMMGAMVFLPLYLQLVMGMSPLQAGMIVTPQIFGVLLSGVVGGRLISKVGRLKPFMDGGVILAAAALWGVTAAIGTNAPVLIFAALLFAFGVGLGLVLPNTTTVVQNAVERSKLGEATGAVTFLRSLGFAVGVSLSGGVVALVLAAKLGPTAGGQASHMQGLLKAGGAAAAAHRGAVIDAYRQAIDASFLLSSCIMTLGIPIVWALPNIALRKHGEAAAASAKDSAPEPIH